MVDIKYANAYSEVLEILKYIPIEDYNKILTNRIELFKANAIQRNKIISKQNYDRLKIEEDKKEKYNVDKIFYNHNKSTFESQTLDKATLYCM